MPVRKTPLVTNEIYHVYNRGASGAPIFLGTRSYRRFIFCLRFYRFQNPPTKLSHFLKSSLELQKEILVQLQQKSQHWVKIYSFCLMPNHFHLLLEQKQDKGISVFLRRLTNSYSTYFNVARERTGSPFQGVFKAALVETEEQLLHVNRYIHINPYVGYVVDRKGLLDYAWSSLPAYLGKVQMDFVEKEVIMSNFSSVESYRRFLLDEAEYKRAKDRFSYLFLE